SQFTGEVYFDRIKKTIIHKEEFSGSIFLIHKKEISWTLTRDTLKIGIYLCYKATTIRTIENSEGTHKLKVTAWYAPEISLPYGPDGYGGLPGLILQLENNGTLTILKRIEFLDAETIKISPPTKGEPITEEEFNAIVSKRFENRKNNKN
ncbi:MAG: GLPGLI family protein, partial [Gelidibacter sp.]|nr:GLPGLI family protein [Gelidibacter sp.]